MLAIAHTPFTEDDEIDAGSLKRAVDWSFSVGADGIGTGMVSETLKLTDHERLSLANMLVAFASNRGPVFVAVGAESTKQSLKHAIAARFEHFARAGRLHRFVDRHHADGIAARFVAAKV